MNQQNGSNGAPPVVGPPMPPGQIPLQVNSGQVGPGVFRLNFRLGPSTFEIDLPENAYEMIARKMLQDVQQARNSIVVVPPGAMPGGRLA